MLKSLRDGAKSPPMRVFLVMLVIGFALWGIDDVFRGLSTNDTAVEIGDVQISATDAANAFERNRRQLLPQASRDEAIAAGLLATTLTGLVQEALFSAEAGRLGLAVTREMEKQALANEPAFLDETGRFSPILFNDALARIGLSEEGFLTIMREAVLRSQMLDAINGGIRYPSATAQAIAEWRLQRRVIRYASIAVDSANTPTPDDAALRTWFATNNSRFDSPDLRFVTVAIADPEVFLDAISITDEALTQAYDERRDLYRRPEQRTIRQMIFATESEARTAISRIRGGETTAQVARAMLNLAADDITLLIDADDVTPVLAEAIFAVAEPRLLEPIETPLGFHVVEIVAITPASTIAFDDLRQGLASELRREAAIDRVYDRINTLEDALSRGQSLENAAREAQLRLITIDGMDRNGLDRDGNPVDALIEGLASDTEFRASIWSASIGEAGIAQEIGTDSFYVARVDREEPARPRPLDEVRDQVIAAMKIEQAIATAKARAEMIANAVSPITTASQLGVAFSTEATVRRDGVGLDHEAARLIAAEAFRLDTGAAGIIETGTEALVITPVAIIDGAADAIAGEANSFRQSLASQAFQSVELALLRGLQDRFDVRVNPTSVQQLLLGVGR